MADEKTPTDDKTTLKSGSPTIDLVNDAIRLRVAKLTRTGKFSAVERSSMHKLAGFLSEKMDDEDPEMARLEYLLAFMEGDIDWKARYKEVFNAEPPTSMPTRGSRPSKAERESLTEQA